MECAKCYTEKPETVTLWDGKEYCEECTGRVHKDLYAYAGRHKTLTSDYRQFSSRRMKWQSFKKYAVLGLFVVGLFAVIAIPAILGQENKQEMMELLAGCVILFPFFYILLLLIQGLPFALFIPSQEAKRHPQIRIADGKVTLSFRRQNTVLPLSAVKLLILPLKRDRFFPQLGWGNKERFSLLDFSECADKVSTSYFGRWVWCTNPYLCFTASRFENGILAAFFRLIGQSNARLEDEVFPTLEESAILEHQLSDGTEIVRSHTSSWAIAAGYAGLFAVLCFPAPIALILGIIALRDCNRRYLKGTGRAIFAIVMGVLFSLALAWFVILEFLF